LPIDTLFAWLISNQPAVFLSQNKSATSQQYSSLTTNQHLWREREHLFASSDLSSMPLREKNWKWIL
jgi:hypothetical protein